MDGPGSCGGHRRAAELTPPSSESGVFSRTFVNSLFDLPCGGCEHRLRAGRRKKKNRRAKMLERRGMNNLLYMGGEGMRVGGRDGGGKGGREGLLFSGAAEASGPTFGCVLWV